jgi:hypothetical protein
VGERAILAGKDKDVEERNVTISFSQSPERATATRGRVQLVCNTFPDSLEENHFTSCSSTESGHTGCGRGARSHSVGREVPCTSTAPGSVRAALQAHGMQLRELRVCSATKLKLN